MKAMHQIENPMEKSRARRLEAERRADELVGKMTLAEKSGELSILIANEKDMWRPSGDKPELGDSMKRLWDDGIGLGAMQCFTRCDFWTERTLELGFTPERCREALHEMRNYAKAHHRLGIPPLFYDDCRHCVPTTGATVFPVGIGRGATWDTSLEQAIGEAIGSEMASLGVNISVGPNMSLARDPRWGRMEECFGEDPYLAGRMGQACVHGLQTPRQDGTMRTAAGIHFVCAMGDSLGGQDGTSVEAGRATLYVLFRPFAMAAEARSAMASYSSIDGIPCHASHLLLTELLRDFAGFQGIIEADATGVAQMFRYSKLFSDEAQCNAAALKAGINMDLMPIGETFAFRREILERALDKGWLTMDDIDRRVREVLAVKFELGLFDDAGKDDAFTFGSEEHRKVALQAARECVTLLANDRGVLPLHVPAPEQMRRVALIGPHVLDPWHSCGDYTPFIKGWSIAEEFAKAMPKGCLLESAQGCDIRNHLPGGIESALEAAEKADVIVLTLGGSSHRYGQTLNAAGGNLDGTSATADCGEGLDRASLEIFPPQMELFRALRKLRKPLVVALIHGRPLNISELLDQADAVLDLWYPGQAGGQALAEAIWGRLNPGGRLPISVPWSVGQVPSYTAVTRPGRRRYTDSPNEPRLPMGFGLSYTTFEYKNLQVTPTAIGKNGRATVSVQVTNTGNAAGDEVVQLYLTDEYSCPLRPARELCGFERVALNPGDTRTVSFVVSGRELAAADSSGKVRVEKGDFLFTVGCPERPLPECRLNIREDWPIRTFHDNGQ